MFVLKCLHGECQLPDNNYRFIWQGVYVAVGVFVLLSDPGNFTYFQTMLFLAPVLIDIVYSGPQNRFVRMVRWGIGAMDVIVMVVCFLGLGGIIVQDTEGYIIVDSMLLFGGFRIEKAAIAVVLVLNILIPAAYYTCSPCKKSAKARAALTTKREARQ